MDVKDSFYPLGDCAVVVKLGREIDMKTHQKVNQFTKKLSQNPFVGMVEFVPAFSTVTVYYEPLKIHVRQDSTPYQTVCAILKKTGLELDNIEASGKNVIEIPVCYGGDFGPDLDFVAKHNGLVLDEVSRIHADGEYPVYMIGFVPGFPYLGGLSERIAAPRKTKPRQKVLAGSVGIAGTQTAIYPIESPGGWQIIGRTPMSLFRPELNSPSLLQIGDMVRFYPISRETFDAWME
jgi:inhibitor of KinA